MIEWNY